MTSLFDESPELFAEHELVHVTPFDAMDDFTIRALGDSGPFALADAWRRLFGSLGADEAVCGLGETLIEDGASRGEIAARMLPAVVHTPASAQDKVDVIHVFAREILDRIPLGASRAVAFTLIDSLFDEDKAKNPADYKELDGYLLEGLLSPLDGVMASASKAGKTILKKAEAVMGMGRPSQPKTFADLSVFSKR